MPNIDFFCKLHCLVEQVSNFHHLRLVQNYCWLELQSYTNTEAETSRTSLEITVWVLFCFVGGLFYFIFLLGFFGGLFFVVWLVVGFFHIFELGKESSLLLHSIFYLTIVFQFLASVALAPAY